MKSNADKPKHHRTLVVKISQLLPCPNSDNLEIIEIEGFQVVVKKGDFSVGQLALYFYPDTVVPIREDLKFLWEDKIIKGGEPSVKHRRVTVRRFRGNWSEGLLIPLPTDLWYDSNGRWRDIQPNNDASDWIGSYHYDPPEPAEFGGQNEKGPRRPKTLNGWLWFLWWKFIRVFGFYPPSNNEKGPTNLPPYYDIENIKHYKGAFEKGEEVWISEKLHGCQGRYIYQDGHMYAGSRKLWKSAKSKNIWRKALEDNPWIESWCKSNPSYTLYGELLPCQGINFQYGIEKGLTKFFVFDILNPSHEWVPLETVELGILNATYPNVEWVPTLYRGPFNLEKIKPLADGKSVLDNKTTREGIVIKPVKERHVRGLGRLKSKLVSNKFLEKS